MIRAAKAVRKTEKKRKKKNVKARVILILSAAGLMGAVYLFFFTSVFELREIRLNGGRYLPLDSLETVTEDFLGENIFTVSISELRKRIMRYPEVGEVKFMRRPFHLIDCYLIERTPVALIALDVLAAVDADGVIIPQRDKAWNVDLPLITGVDSKEISEKSGNVKILKALRVLELLKEFGFSPAEQLSEIHVVSEDVQLVWLGEGTLIQVGREKYLQRIRNLRAVYSVLADCEKFPKFIDLRFERQVVIR